MEMPYCKKCKNMGMEDIEASYHVIEKGLCEADLCKRCFNAFRKLRIKCGHSDILKDTDHFIVIRLKEKVVFS